MTPLSLRSQLRLSEAGWHAGSRDDHQARRLHLFITLHRTSSGLKHTVHPAAVEAWTLYGSVRVEQEGAGEHLALRSFSLVAADAVHTAQGCSALGQRIGHPLAPLGTLRSGEAFLLIDDTGRVFSRDHTGDWFLGDDVNAAINTLTAGTAFTRVREDGTW